MLLWFEDPQREFGARYVSLSTSPELPFDEETGASLKRVTILGHEGYLMWIGDPGVGDVAVVWAEDEAPCSVLALGIGTVGLTETEAEALVQRIANSLVNE